MAQHPCYFFRPGPVTDTQLTGLTGPTYAALNNQLSSLYNCTHQHHNHQQHYPEAISTDALKKMLEDVVKKVWKIKAPPEEIDKALTEFFASEFWKAVQKGYGIKLDDANIGADDVAMLQKLKESVYQFASAKNYAQMKALSEALLNPDGELRTFTEFRTAAAEINNQFSNTWLKSEYNYAVASSQMASKWKQIESAKDVLKLLQYETAGDERVRPEHQELEGVIQPVDSVFWDTYYPPNGWGCRCDTRQLYSGKITPLNQIILPDKQPSLFNYNSGKQKVVFPPGHPYYDGLPDKIKQQAKDLMNGKPE